MVRIRQVAGLTAVMALWATLAMAQTTRVDGVVRDETGGALPGVAVTVRQADGTLRATTTDAEGRYRIEGLSAGRYELSVALINFAGVQRTVTVSRDPVRADVVLHLTLSADVVVTGRQTFTNLADADDPATDLVGIAQSASQGAITARQLEVRPIMRAGEVLETVPGVVISQHSGEGKANQYYLRGFNLDHGTDFATTVAGMPVNMPTHGHGQGYSDLNFLIPELISGVQFSKGPYFAEHGDFAAAGAANINYTNALERPLVEAGAGDQGFGRVVAAASPAVGGGRLLAGLELERNDGPWTRPDSLRKVNGIARYTRGDRFNAFSVTGMAYRATWDSTDQVPQRAISANLIGRFGALDLTDGGDTYRHSGSFEWQRTRGNAATKASAYGIGYDLNLYSNFTFFLDDPEHGDQFHQADHRFVSGGRVSHRRLGRWGGKDMQNTVGVQLRNDNIGKVGLYHTEGRQFLDTVREDAVVETSAGAYVQNETVWTPWLRSLAGLRVDGYRFDVEAGDPVKSGVIRAAIASPKGGIVVGPWRGTEFYGNAGLGFHSNDARGTTISIDPSSGAPADRVTPLVRASGAEVGVRTVAIPHLHTSATFWTLGLESELLFVGDAGTTEANRPSHRHGLEIANYFSPRSWLTIDGDLSWSSSRFTDDDVVGAHIPGSVRTVVSVGATVEGVRHVFGSVRLRYFGPRPLLEDDSVRSAATSLLNAGGGYRLTRRARIAVEVFNLLNARDSDIDYFYTSRLANEPLGGYDDIHLHPTLPRTARVSLRLGF